MHRKQQLDHDVASYVLSLVAAGIFRYRRSILKIYNALLPSKYSTVIEQKERH